MTAFTRTELPRGERLDLALFAQAEYATLYRMFEHSPPGDPEDLCRALEILALADPLVATDEERRKLEKWRSAHRSALRADYPEHRCTLVAAPDVPTNPSQEQTPRDLAPPAESPPIPVAPLERRILVLHVGGGISLGLGVASLAAMAGVLGARTRVLDSAEAHKAELDGKSVDPALKADIAALEDSYDRLGRAAVVTGLVGGVMLLTGSIALGRGRYLYRRLQLAPDVDRGHAGLVLTGRF